VLYGSVYFITAYPPTTRNWTSSVTNADNRSFQSETIRSIAELIDMIFDGHFQGGPDNCLVALGLPEVYIERTIHFFDSPGALHHTSSGYRRSNSHVGMCCVFANSQLPP